MESHEVKGRHPSTTLRTSEPIHSLHNVRRIHDSENQDLLTQDRRHVNYFSTWDMVDDRLDESRTPVNLENVSVVATQSIRVKSRMFIWTLPLSFQPDSRFYHFLSRSVLQVSLPQHHHQQHSTTMKHHKWTKADEETSGRPTRVCPEEKMTPHRMEDHHHHHHHTSSRLVLSKREAGSSFSSVATSASSCSMFTGGPRTTSHRSNPSSPTTTTTTTTARERRSLFEPQPPKIIMRRQDYRHWHIRGIRSGLSVRIIRAEIKSSRARPNVAQYVCQVLDTRTGVCWSIQKRYRDFFQLRKAIHKCLLEKNERDSHEYLKTLGFPRRKLRTANHDTIHRRRVMLETYLRNIAAVDPHLHATGVDILTLFQQFLCSREFISSLEDIDDREAREKHSNAQGQMMDEKWLEYEVFKNVNSCQTIEGQTCERTIEAFRNRCAVTQAAMTIVEKDKDEEDARSCAQRQELLKCMKEALVDLRLVLTKIEKYILEQLADRFHDHDHLGPNDHLHEQQDLAGHPTGDDGASSSSSSRVGNQDHQESENPSSSLETSLPQELWQEREEHVRREVVYRMVEDTVVVPLQEQIHFLVNATLTSGHELRLDRKIRLLRRQSQHFFGIPRHFQSSDAWGHACHVLRMIDDRILPTDMLDDLISSANIIFQSCETRPEEEEEEYHCRTEEEEAPRRRYALTADEFLPIHIYVVVHSTLRRPLFIKELLGAMIHPSKMINEVGYFLTMFEVALQYIMNFELPPST